MRNKFKITTVIVSGICLFALPLCGCGASNNLKVPNNFLGRNMVGVTPRVATPKVAAPTISPSGISGLHEIVKGTPLVKNRPTPTPGNMPKTTSLFDKNKANTLVINLTKLAEVKAAKAVVKGDTAVIWFEALSNKNLTATKSKIMTRVKQMDNSIKSIYVSSSPKIMADINKLQKEITTGGPILGLTDKFNRLMINAKI